MVDSLQSAILLDTPTFLTVHISSSYRLFALIAPIKALAIELGLDLAPSYIMDQDFPSHNWTIIDSGEPPGSRDDWSASRTGRVRRPTKPLSYS